MRVLAALLALVPVIALAPAAQAAPPPTTLSIFPKPQQAVAGSGVLQLGEQATLVVGAHTDAPALAATRAALRSAGVRHLREVDEHTDPGSSPVTVYVGGKGENQATAGALAALGVHDATGLPAEGYVLAVGTGRIVLDGVDPAGTFYAAQTLRQIIHSGPNRWYEIRDWPTLPIRGVIEGFYGTPWSDANRLDQLDFYGRHKMNTYVYSPKDDPYLRASWRDPYPADKLAALKGLVDRATANHVEFTYAISPGLSVCYSDPAEAKAIGAKFQSLWDIGVRTFAVPLDDISYTKWNCAADATRFGTGGAAAGAAQSFLLNAVQREFIATHPGAGKLEMVPTEYSDLAATPYKNTLAAQLDPAVLVEWTGTPFIAPVITDEQAAAARKVYGHEILVWDNYPVNDYITGQLLLGPYVGRGTGLAASLAGITANPMIQAEASKISEFTIADFVWNSAGYQPQRSWDASLTELAGGEPDALAALRLFADLNYTSDLDQRQAPALAAKIDSFWRTGDIAALHKQFELLDEAPDQLRDSLPDKQFLTETQLWLDATKAWAKAADKALDLVEQQRSQDGASAWRDRQALLGLVAKAHSFRYTKLDGSKQEVLVGQGVLDKFIAKVLQDNNKALGITPVPATAQASLPTYESYVPANMVDGNPATFYWSNGPVHVGDTVGVDLGSVRTIGAFTALMAKSGSAEDYVHSGVVEYSADGTTWTTGQSFSNTPELVASPPAGTTARYVRLRATADQDNWLVVRELSVATVAVTGGPAGTGLPAVADGNPDTAYRAAGAPATGDALTVSFTSQRLTGVVVLGSAGRAQVQVHEGGTWRTVGRFGGGYTQLDLPKVSADSVRLLWSADSPAPVINELIAH
ncbi:beta-N-acetylglucosaminidase domain-containing protein [Kutzneria albida]|uniref:Beta-N-acetylhexosaminidase n=1 Tax=Kutzneria albida DSM 43870 TaxID=1449976 RepID=W5W4K7_9PSEU|nr:beta-N-acetylglucosaminidase domain-containing protein [Kutzneria albida]AHH95822.1 beta-N-acetylhexosaminidase [Kutzneria albida DSM 43870]